MVEQSWLLVCSVPNTGSAFLAKPRPGVRRMRRVPSRNVWQRTECGDQWAQHLNRGLPHGGVPRNCTNAAPRHTLRAKDMQADQHTPNHPIPFRHAERQTDFDAIDDVADSHGNGKHRESTDRHAAIEAALGRRPARSAEVTPRYRR